MSGLLEVSLVERLDEWDCRKMDRSRRDFDYCLRCFGQLVELTDPAVEG